MEKPAKTNRLATTSFVCALLLMGLWLLKPVFFPLLEGNVAVFVIAALTVASPLTGILALIQLRRQNGAEQECLFAWLGILLTLISPLCQLVFLMAASWSGY
jgi:hypothetical protein